MPARYVHPFPARMAPQVALDAVRDMRDGGVVLDPMCGSGTVLHAAVQNGLAAVGKDIDPLAVLMSRVAMSKPRPARVRRLAASMAERAAAALDGAEELPLPWVDEDRQALAYVRYWFAPQQERQLRALARALPDRGRTSRDLLRLAISRTIIRKERGASLARDVPHSRPHKVTDTNDFDVLAAFTASVDWILKAIDIPPDADAAVSSGDARDLGDVADGSIAGVVTSPPYLNAIDYIRGHRLALIWLGSSLGELRDIRSSGIGAERAPDERYDHRRIDELLRANGSADALPQPYRNMFRRYAGDMDRVLAEVSRVLEASGRAIFVIGNSAIRGVPVDNAAVVNAAARAHGLELEDRKERPLPPNSRYLPPPPDDASPLARRMRKEVILTFRKGATGAAAPRGGQRRGRRCSIVGAPGRAVRMPTHAGGSSPSGWASTR